MLKQTSSVFFVCFLLLMSCASSKTTSTAELQSVVIHTSSQCEMCKDKIETKLQTIGGVKSADLNLKTGDVKVQFNPEKVNADKLKKTISALGYDADDVKGDPEAYKLLPACCKKK